MARTMVTAAVLVFVGSLLLCGGIVGAQQNATASAPATNGTQNAKGDAKRRLTKSECEARLNYEEFATDDRVISCVRNASAACCDAMGSHLGKESEFYLCTCSAGLLERVLSEAVPSFAQDLIQERILECGLPVAGEDVCKNLYDDANVAAFGVGGGTNGSCDDTLPPVAEDNGYTCAEQAGFGKCDEGWMDGYCLLSCDRCDQAPAAAAVAAPADDAADEGDGDAIPPTTGNCTDTLPPVAEDNGYNCSEQAGFGKCEEGWMEGYCLISCGVCQPESNATVEAGANATAAANATQGTPAAAVLDKEIVEGPGRRGGNGTSGAANATNTTYGPAGGSDNCTDALPPVAKDNGYNCSEQAGFGKCDADWMEGFCLLSCGECEPAGRIKSPGVDT